MVQENQLKLTVAWIVPIQPVAEGQFDEAFLAWQSRAHRLFAA